MKTIPGGSRRRNWGRGFSGSTQLRSTEDAAADGPACGPSPARSTRRPGSSSTSSLRRPPRTLPVSARTPSSGQPPAPAPGPGPYLWALHRPLGPQAPAVWELLEEGQLRRAGSTDSQVERLQEPPPGDKTVVGMAFLCLHCPRPYGLAWPLPAVPGHPTGPGAALGSLLLQPQLTRQCPLCPPHRCQCSCRAWGLGAQAGLPPSPPATAPPQGASEPELRTLPATWGRVCRPSPGAGGSAWAEWPPPDPAPHALYLLPP